MPQDTNSQSARAAREAHFQAVILAAAEAEFVSHGFDGARIQAIAARAGVALRTLYAHFAGKAELRRAVHDLRLSQMIEEANRRDLPIDPGEALLEGLEGFVRWIAAHPDYLRLTEQEGLSWASPTLFAGPDSTSVWETGIDLLAEMIRTGMDHGSLLPGDPQRTSRLLVASLQVFVTDWNTRGGDTEALVGEVRAFVRRAFFEPNATPRAARSAT